MPNLNRPGLVYGEEFYAGCAIKPSYGPVGHPDPVIVFPFSRAQFFLDESLVGIGRTVEVGVFPGGTKGQDTGLVYGDIAQFLSFGSELQFFFVLLPGFRLEVFSHRLAYPRGPSVS